MKREEKRDGPWKLPPPPWVPPEWAPADITAVQALLAGTADAEQQQRAIKWIIFEVGDKDGTGWHPQDPHLAAFAAGRRWVGLQIAKALMINVAAIVRNQEHA